MWGCWQVSFLESISYLYTMSRHHSSEYTCPFREMKCKMIVTEPLLASTTDSHNSTLNAAMNNVTDKKM